MTSEYLLGTQVPNETGEGRRFVVEGLHQSTVKGLSKEI